jgi:hypothetical protein
MQQLLNNISERYGFITSEDRDTILAAQPDFRGQVLVRCGCNRFLCTLQDLPARMQEVEAQGDYVRDVCVPASPQPVLWHRIGYRSP